jgi:hypothetical protein
LWLLSVRWRIAQQQALHIATHDGGDVGVAEAGLEQLRSQATR